MWGLCQFLPVIALQRRWPELLQLLDEGAEFVDQLRRFRRRNPACLQACFVDPAECQHLLKNGYTLLGGQITIQVIAFTQTSAAYEDAIDSALKSKKNMMRRNAATTHHPDGTNIRRVLQTTDPSQVSSCVCSPGAQKTNDLGLKNVVTHFSFPLCKRKTRWPESEPAAVPVYNPSVWRCAKDMSMHSCRILYKGSP